MSVVADSRLRYELSARDNVRMADLTGETSQADLDAVASAAGASDVIAGLPYGWDTILSRRYARGAELSGGQWQRVALARALFAVRVGAGLLVLDEPTASLDIRAEAELFDRFLEWTSRRILVTPGFVELAEASSAPRRRMPRRNRSADRSGETGARPAGGDDDQAAESNHGERSAGKRQRITAGERQ